MWPGSHLANPIQQPCHHLESASFDIRHHKAIKIKSDHSSPTSPCCLILIAVSTYKYQSRFPVSISNISRNSQFCGDVSLQKGIQKWWLSNNQMEPWQRPRRRHPTAALLHCCSHVIRLAGPLQIERRTNAPRTRALKCCRFTFHFGLEGVNAGTPKTCTCLIGYNLVQPNNQATFFTIAWRVLLKEVCFPKVRS